MSSLPGVPSNLATVPSAARAVANNQTRTEFARDLLDGLSRRPKRLHPKYFYDTIGSQLFERITNLPEYYPTRTELQILADNAEVIARFIPDRAALVEFGSGASTKVRLLLKHLPRLCAYVPVDISAEFLDGEANRLGHEFGSLAVIPVAADFTKAFELPDPIRIAPLAGFFPGSTIGNFEPDSARDFLQLARRILGPRGIFIVGVDLVKNTRVLEAAYNDAVGVTAAFNLNILARANRELGADFDLRAFEHRAFYNAAESRIEMHLVSRTAQTVRALGRCFVFAAGENIHTENSYKYTVKSFSTLARRAGWQSTAVFEDPDALFSVHVLRAKPFAVQ